MPAERRSRGPMATEHAMFQLTAMITLLSFASIFVSQEPQILDRFHLRNSTSRVAALPALNLAVRSRDTLLVSPDNRRIAYVATAGDKELVVVDRDRGKSYTAVRSLTFSAN